MSKILLPTTDERSGEFCPECGQSLDLTRRQEIPVKSRTLEPFVFLIFGLCLTVAFGLRAWNTRLEISTLDREVATLRAQATQGPLPRPGNPSMLVADILDEEQTDQVSLGTEFQRDMTGLWLGLVTVMVGGVCWLRERFDVVEQCRRHSGLEGLRSSDELSGISPLDLCCLVATTWVRMTLLLFVIIVGLQVIRGVPPSVDLLDQALTRIVALVVTITRALS